MSEQGGMLDDMIRVLVVEDDDADARLVVEAFRNAHGALCVPNRVKTLAAAVEWVGENPCDAVLLDLTLPDARGLETLQTMLRAARGAPVLVVSGHDDPDFAAMAVEVGAQDYLVKGSFDGGALVRALRHALARKELEEQARLARQRVENIVELAHDAIVAVAADRTVVMVNPAAEKLFGWPAELLIGRSAELLIPDGECWRPPAGPEPGGAAAPPREFSALRRDGSRTTVEAAVSPTPTPEGLLFTAVIRDVAERRKAERELRAAKEAAENALTERDRAQARMVQAERLSALGQLVSSLSHEINSPIADALAAASMLEAETFDLRVKLGGAAEIDRDGLTAHVEAAEENLHRIMGALRRAAELMGQFKQTAERGNASRRCRFSLKHLLGDFAAAAASVLGKSGCVLDVECPDDIEMDSHPVALSQALSQLALNAAQHARPTDRPTGRPPCIVRLRVERRGEREIRLELQDDGAGVPEEHRRRVFEPFFTTRRADGHAGLGLHIVFNLVVGTLGGFVSLETASPDGARFVIDLPQVAPN